MAQDGLTLQPDLVVRDTERTRADEKFRALLEGLSEANLIVDGTGTVVLVNLRAEQLFGYPRSELLGASALMLLPERLREAQAGWLSQPTGARADKLETYCLHKDGSEFPAEVSLNLLESGGEQLISTTIVDVSGRRTLQDQQVLLRLGEDLSRFDDPDALAQHVTVTVGRYFDVERCTFSEIDVDSNLADCRADYARSGASLKGKRPLDMFSRLVRDDCRAGRPIAVVDAERDPRIERDEAARYASVDIRSFAGVPLMRDGSWIGQMAVFDSVPRGWAPRELQMLQAFAERMWLWMEHLRSLRSLRESEQLYRRLIESTPQGVWEIDALQRTRFVNARMARIVGSTPGAMQGRPAVEFVHDSERDAMQHAFERRRQGLAESLDVQLRHADGRSVWARMVANPLFDEFGQFVGSLAIVSDVTERRKAEEDQQFLLELSERLTIANDSDVALDAATRHLCLHLGADACGYVALDVDTDRATLRTLFERTPGQSVQSLPAPSAFGTVMHDLSLGRHAAIAATRADPRTVAAYAKLWRPCAVEAVILIPVHRDGRLEFLFLLSSRSPRRWAPREIALAHATVERTALCVQRLQTMAALRDFNRALEQRVQERTVELQAALRDKEVLLKEIHHRVKNNLQVISSMLNLQASYLSDANSKVMFAEAQGRVQSIALVHEALYRAKDLSSVSADEYLQNLLTAIFQAQCAPERRVKRALQCDCVRLPVALAIPCGLIVNELVTNALKHAFPAGRAGTVAVRVRRSAPSELELSVCDDGVGLPAGYEASHRASLGLELVYTFAEQIDATVELRREQGTAFYLRFCACE